MTLSYLMHVDWNWIKQRPHFIAEHLSNSYNLKCYYRINPRYIKKMFSGRSASPNAIPLLPLPSSNRLCNLLQRAWLRLTQRCTPDFVWVTHPTLCQMVPKSWRKSKLIYDCMDDNLEFLHSPQARINYLALEKQLFDASDLIICSSETLRHKIIERGASEEITHLVRNGLPSTLLEHEICPQPVNSRFKIGYFGTISEWIDFPLVLKLLDNFSEIEFHFIGPIVNIEAPTHPRIIYHGPIEHRNLVTHAQQWDACIMPFILSPLIESVDPVKAYEYISFKRTTILPFYSEVAQFDKFVSFYYSHENCINVFSELITNGFSLTTQDASEFLKQSTWEARCNRILELLTSTTITKH